MFVVSGLMCFDLSTFVVPLLDNKSRVSCE